MRKPDPRWIGAAVYRRCLARMGAAADATLFVDDSPDNIAGARAAGLHGHDYVSPEAFEQDLCERGLLMPR